MTLHLHFNDGKIDISVKDNIINNFQDCDDISVCNVKTYMSTLGINYDSIEMKVIRNDKRINYVDDDFIVQSTDLIYVNIVNKPPFVSIPMVAGSETQYVKFVSTNVTIIDDVDKYIKNVTTGLELYEENTASEMYDKLCDIIEKLEENGNVSNKPEIDIYVTHRSKLWNLLRSHTKPIQRPERVPSPYIKFCTTIRPAMKRQNPDMSFGEMGRKLGLAWSELTPEQKNEYN